MEKIYALESSNFKMDAENRLAVHNWDENHTKIKGQVSYKRSLKDFNWVDFMPDYSYEDGKSYGYQEEESILVITYNNNKEEIINSSNNHRVLSLKKKMRHIKRIDYVEWVYDSWTSNEFSNFKFTVVFE